ncbi:DUF5671 domain-containing protein [Salipiger abyssi]|uniref:DUF5671 domain-containing protein n=1 Tax=Salipiger abyssi TaxID=1250539 RepID=A0A1P8UUE3_9RHOB|nr:DUF5671 domain-containing protein [Salipiger abyssi]APZ52978.1 hypothetical protein Ga0080574_TMP2644 [Salipiger abyssi]
MSVPSDLARFVHEALKRGQSREAIHDSLLAAGWTETEAAQALAGWTDTLTEAGPVPRPLRSSAAKDAFFYALLFVAFGMVAGNALTLLFGWINVQLPDRSSAPVYAAGTLRWSLAALIVFTPAFWLLDRADARAARTDSARGHGAIRRWLSSLAMLIAVVTLMGDALYLIYTFLNGQITARFLAKSATVALIFLMVLAYFRQDRAGRATALPTLMGAAPVAVAVLSAALAFPIMGGPGRGQMEQRDRSRIADLRTLTQDVLLCLEIDHETLPETLDPMSCARNPQRLTGFAAGIAYHRISDTAFELCTEIEFPPAIQPYGLTLTERTACMRQQTE